MEEKALPNELAKLTSLTYRIVYRLVKATAMSLAIGYIAGWKAGFSLFMLFLVVDSIEDSFSKSYKLCGLRTSLTSLFCGLVFLFFLWVIAQEFLHFPHLDKEMVLFIAFPGLIVVSSCIDFVAAIKKQKEAD